MLKPWRGSFNVCHANPFILDMRKMTNRSFGFDFYFCVSLSSSDPGSSSVWLGISVSVFPDNILHSDKASLRQPEQ